MYARVVNKQINSEIFSRHPYEEVMYMYMYHEWANSSES